MLCALLRMVPSIQQCAGAVLKGPRQLHSRTVELRFLLCADFSESEKSAECELVKLARALGVSRKKIRRVCGLLFTSWILRCLDGEGMAMSVETRRCWKQEAGVSKPLTWPLPDANH